MVRRKRNEVRSYSPTLSYGDLCAGADSLERLPAVEHDDYLYGAHGVQHVRVMTRRGPKSSARRPAAHDKVEQLVPRKLIRSAQEV